MIRSKPSTDTYREAWERVFGGRQHQRGDRVVWHAPAERASCRCDKSGTILRVEQLPNGRPSVTAVSMDDGTLIDPSIDPDLLRPVGEPCPFGGGPLIPLGASVD